MSKIPSGTPCILILLSFNSTLIFFKIHGVFPIVFVCVCVYSLSLNPVRKTDPERERLKQSKAFLKHVYKSYLFPF